MDDIILAACAIVGAILYLCADAVLKVPYISDPVGPRAFPALIGVVLLFSGILLLFERRTRKEQEVSSPVSSDSWRHQKVLIVILVWTALYYTAFEPVGYLLSTAIYILGLLTGFRHRATLSNILIAISFSLVVDLVFTKLLNVELPVGLLGP
jgi:putative tricarboxylic transport membrane protein